MRLKIGEFARVSQVPVKTLRYYDEIGLLKPAEVDRFTDYRYYSFNQLPRINRILALKDLGLSLEQISRLLEDNLSADEVQGMLRLRQMQLVDELEEMQAQLARVTTRISQIRKEGKMPTHEVVLKTVEPAIVASRRITITDDAPTAVAEAFADVQTFIDNHDVKAAGPGFSIWHTPAYTSSDEEAEIAIPINKQIDGNDLVQIRTLPAARVASIVHSGLWEQLNDAYQAVLSWMDANGYQIDGPFREIYHAYHHDDSKTSITEIQFPATKA